MSIITAYPHIKETKTGHHISIDEFIRYVIDGRWQDAVTDARRRMADLTFKADRQEVKKKLPYVTISGSFRDRSEKGLIKHSGFIGMDLDDLEDPARLRDQLKKDPYVKSAFITIGGKGLCVIYKIDPKRHKEAFDAISVYLKEEYQVAVDTSTSDVSRARYITFDPDSFNHDCKEFDQYHLLRPEVSKPEAKPSQLVAPQRADKNKKQRVEDAVKYLEKHQIDITGNYDNWVAIGLALVSEMGEVGRAYFHRVSAIYSEYNSSETDKKYNDLMGKAKGRVSLASFFYFCRQAGVPLQEVTKTEGVFWWIHKDKKAKEETIHIKLQLFVNFLEQNGFRKIMIGKHDHRFVRIQNNIVYETNPTQMQDFVMDYIKSLTHPIPLSQTIEPADLIEKILKGIHVYFSAKILQSIPTLDLKTLKDDQNTAYIYFSNCFAKITAQGIRCFDYSELPGLVWDRQIRRRSFNFINCFTDDISCEFDDYMFNICGKNDDRYRSLITIIGYLLHGYNSKKMPAAVIFMDESISENPEGGTGKGILLQALAEFKNMAKIPGKNFNFDNPFVWQRVDLDTQIVAFEDVEKWFDFEKLFSLLTEGWNIRKLYSAEFYIPFEDAPKTVISTNYTIQGEGNSHERRKIEFEFSGHYNATHTPFDDFGHLLFDDWDETEWNKFYNLMIHALQIYLKHGVIKPAPINSVRKKMMQATSDDFIEFMENLDKRQKYERGELYSIYTEKYPDDGRKLTRNRFYKWCRRWMQRGAVLVSEFDVKNCTPGWKMNEISNKGKRFFTFENPNGSVNDSKAAPPDSKAAPF